MRQAQSWYINPENGDTKIFWDSEADVIAKAGYRLVVPADIPLLQLHAKGLLVKTPADVLADLRTGKLTLEELAIDEGEGKVYRAGISELGRLL